MERSQWLKFVEVDVSPQLSRRGAAWGRPPAYVWVVQANHRQRNSVTERTPLWKATSAPATVKWATRKWARLWATRKWARLWATRKWARLWATRKWARLWARLEKCWRGSLGALRFRFAMATVPTVLPLDVAFTAYQVRLPVKGKEFVVGVHNVEAGKSLGVAKLDCCSELRKLLTGFEHIIQKRLNQSMDVATFVEELKDVLERILLAQPLVKVAPAAFYGRICSEIEEVGWEHIAWVAPSFMSIHLRFFDQAKREHLLHIQLSPDYPEKEPSCNADLPIALEIQWRAGGRLKDILSECEQAAEKYQDFWTVMEDIDKHVWVMEPEHPSRSNCFRRIALGGHCSLCITVEPVSPRMLPEYRFFGSDTAVGPLRLRMSSNMDCWKMERLVRENLEDVLGVTFPSPQDSDRDDVSSECIICYSYRLLDGKEGASEKGSVPDRVCDNGSCGRPFHTSCLAEWLRSLPTTRQSFDVLFGACPHCSHPVIVKCSFS